MLPEGLPGAGGYREHDILVVTEDGNRNITGFPYGHQDRQVYGVVILEHVLGESGDDERARPQAQGVDDEQIDGRGLTPHLVGHDLLGPCRPLFGALLHTN